MFLLYLIATAYVARKTERRERKAVVGWGGMQVSIFFIFLSHHDIHLMILGPAEGGGGYREVGGLFEYQWLTRSLARLGSND